MRYEKAERVMELAVAMQASRMGITLGDIQDRFAVGERTAQRMRDAVLRLFPQAEEFTDEERHKRWRIPTATVTGLVRFTADELADLELTARLLTRENQRSRAKSLSGVAAKIRALLRDGAARRLEPDLEALLEAEGIAMRPGPRPLIRGEVLSILRTAVKGNSKVYIVHRNRQTKRRSGRTVEPYGFLLGHRHYLVARSPGRQPQMRLFSLANIDRVKVLDQGFTRDPDFSIQAYAEQSFGVFQEEPFDVVWRFTPSAASDAREFLFHPTQTMEERPDGSLIVRFRAGGALEMCWHLFTWGDSVEVIEPRKLRKQFDRMRCKD